MTRENVKYVLVTVLLGAIGSGLWNYAGEPLLKWISATYISAAQKLNSGYYDYLHSEIGKGTNSQVELLTATLSMAIFILLILLSTLIMRFQFLSTEAKTISSSERNSAIKVIDLLFYIGILAAIIFFFGIVSTVIKQTYRTDAVIFIERSLDIIAPKIDQQKNIAMRAQYRSIESANDFYVLHDELITLGKENSLKLPEFDVAR